MYYYDHHWYCFILALSIVASLILYSLAILTMRQR